MLPHHIYPYLKKKKKEKKSTQSILEKKITFIRKQSTKKTITMATLIIPWRPWRPEIRHLRRRYWGDWASWACPSLRRRCYPEVTSSRMGSCRIRPLCCFLIGTSSSYSEPYFLRIVLGHLRGNKNSNWIKFDHNLFCSSNVKPFIWKWIKLTDVNYFSFFSLHNSQFEFITYLFPFWIWAHFCFFFVFLF